MTETRISLCTSNCFDPVRVFAAFAHACFARFAINGADRHLSSLRVVGGEPWPRRSSYQRQWLEEAILPLFILPRSVQFVCFHHPCGSTNRIWQIGLGTQCAEYLGPSQWMLVCTKRKTARGLEGLWSVYKAGPKMIKMMIFWADLFTGRLPSVW